MENLLTEIEKCIEIGLYQTALGMTLSIPDICAALESNNGEASGDKYRKWFDTYVTEEVGISSDDCYYFRCSFLHQRSTFHKKSSYSRIVFAEPTSSNTFHSIDLMGTFVIDLKTFCYEIINAARRWLDAVENDPNFIKNKINSFKKQDNGLLPLVGGITVYG